MHENNSSDRPTGSGKRIEVNPVKGALEQPYLPFVKWSPANDFLAFAYDRHVYIHIYPFDESRSAVLNITRELPDDKIQYGQCDWMYEEEVLQTNVALWWNPSGTKLAFLSFDERNVSVYEIFRFDTEGGLYGTSIRQNYPKAGDPSAYNNPKIGLHMYDLGTGKLMEFPRPSSIPWDGHLVFTKWYNDDILLVCWTDRIQSQAWITVVSWSTGSSWIIFKTSATDGWVDMFKQMSNEPLVHPESQSLFIILPREYTEAGYRGIARLSVDLSGTEIKQQVRWMIAPSFDVTDILYFNGIDEFLFLSPGPDPKNLHVYWGSAGGDIYCLTCDNGNCTYNRAKVSSDGWHFVQECRGPDVPSYFLKTINRTTDISGGHFVSAYHRFTLLDNMMFRQRINSRAMAKIEFVNLTLREGTRDQLKVDAKLMLPPALNKQHITKYPLLLFTYGGPSKQLVTTKFLLDWSTFLAATAKVIVAVVDGRGTGGRGIRFEHAIYRKLGVVEIEDQLHAIKAMVKTFRFINETQIGAYGWSYGGFTVGHLLAHPENNLVRCGIAVAPVTDFRFYDTAYTERYLGRITDHPDAYMQTSIAKRARNMRSKSLLIAHGSADDNVHLINTVSLTKALIAANVDIDVMIYPDDNHFIPTAANREHLYRKMTTFLMDCYNKTSIRYTMDLTVKDDL
ncbi:unnamed protein product [Dicrocoelium dendriticum]|nr:unnamed protein product [Dicrocoelium dendriticum]